MVLHALVGRQPVCGQHNVLQASWGQQPACGRQSEMLANGDCIVGLV